MQSLVLERRYRRVQDRRRKNRGMTLIEVMIVLFILIVLAGIGVVAVQGTLERAKINEATIFVRSMKGSLDQYLVQFGDYPSTAEGLDALLNPPDGGKPLVEHTAAKPDPWGNPYQYQYPGNMMQGGYDLWSFGPDRIPDSGDEIGNWN